MAEYKVTLSDDEVRILRTVMVDIQAWIDNAVQVRIQAAAEKAMETLSPLNYKKMGKASIIEELKKYDLPILTEGKTTIKGIK